MKTFRPGPATKSFYDQLITIANAPAYMAANAGGNLLMRLNPYTLPTPPPDPVDYLDRMFLHNICMPLYNAVVAAYQADNAAYLTVIGVAAAQTPGTVAYAQSTGDWTGVSATDMQAAFGVSPGAP